MIFRVLEKEDLDREDFRALIEQLTDRRVDWNMMKTEVNNKYFLSVVVENDEGKIIGYGSFPLYPSLVKGLTAVLEDLVVDRDYQHQGIAKEIQNLLDASAVAMGAKVAILTSNPSRERARKMYESRGYVLKDTGFFEKHLVS